MNVDSVEKEYDQELLRLKLSGMTNLLQEERKNQEELRKLEQDHEKEMSRLRGQVAEEEYQSIQMEWKRTEDSRRHHRETKELERKNKREEEEMREQRMKQSKESLRQEANFAFEQAQLFQKTLDRNLTLHDDLDNVEKVKTAKKIILETDSMWTNVKEVYELMKLVYFVDGHQETFDEETKNSLLRELNQLLAKKDELAQYSMTARKSLGKWKPVADEQCYQEVESCFNKMTEALKTLEKAITVLRKEVKLNKPLGQSALSGIDLIMDQCQTLFADLAQNPMHTKKTFQQMLDN